MSSPDLLRAFAAINERMGYGDQVKPANFVLTAHVAPFGHPDGVDPTRFQLFAPFESDPDRWLSTPWEDKYSGRAYRIGVGPATHPALVRVKSIGELVAEHRAHPEAKSLDAEGRPCTVRTVGLLFRRPVQVDDVVYIGKEANALARDVQPFLANVPASVLARAARRTLRMAKYYKAGDFRPTARVLGQLLPALARLAKRYLRRRLTPIVVRRDAERLLASPLTEQVHRHRT